MEALRANQSAEKRRNRRLNTVWAHMGGRALNPQKPGKLRAPALAYLRTSSAANVGTDKDSEKRQRHAIQGFAKRAGFGIVDEFYDAAVSGADPIETRAGFAALLDRIEGNGVRTVIVEDASRFARELMAQESGITLLISRGVQLLTASGDDLTAQATTRRGR
jgi:DNA invertase Pin-like site-specific DNA recombinase